jgi:hypothetical protein
MYDAGSPCTMTAAGACSAILKILPYSLLLLMAVAGATEVSARDHTTLATFAGKCTKVTVMNVQTDPNLCSDKITNIKLGSGQSGYAFLLHPQAEMGPFVMSFLGTKPRHEAHHKGALVLPVHRVYVTFDGRTDDLVAVGSCAFSSPNKKAPTRVSCSASTIEGDFAGEFIGADHNTGGMKMLTDHEATRSTVVCGQPPVQTGIRAGHDLQGCTDPTRQSRR